MRLIAKRGLFNGPNPEKENTWEQIQLALSKGFDVEVDARLTSKGIFLGHDEPKQKIDESLGYPSFFDDPRIWTHCKTKETYDYLAMNPFIKAFCHEDEDYAYINGMEFKWQHGRLGKYVYYKTNYGWQKYGIYRDNFELKNVFIDVDGVMCKGKQYNSEHKCIGKTFVDSDFTAIKRMKAAGLNVVLISGDEWNRGLTARNVHFIKAETLGEFSKLNMLSAIGYDLEKSLYVGDDYYDLPLLNACGFPFCPNDAISEVKRESIVLSRSSGEGVLAEMYDQLCNMNITKKVAPLEG